jgi:hypothetical protein
MVRRDAAKIETFTPPLLHVGFNAFLLVTTVMDMDFEQQVPKALTTLRSSLEQHQNQSSVWL